MAVVRNALVVGGGIGGLTASVALRQAEIGVDLIELHPEFRVYGVGIIQPNNTLRALHKVGLASRCLELGAPFPGWKIHDHLGNLLMKAPNESRAAPDYPPNLGITRPDLHDVLSEAAYEHGVNVKLGTTIKNLVDNKDGVDVEFSNGEGREYDLVIGCDGVYSDTRERLFGRKLQPEFTGQAVWRYNFDRPPEMEWGEIHMGPRTKVGLVPMQRDLMYMFLVSAEPGNPKLPADELATLMRERLTGFGDRIMNLAARITDPSKVVYKPMENLILPNPWHKGRTLIIGDAAHATTPHLAQGAAMAIEDAVLIAELLKSRGNLDQVLSEFMSRRFERAKYVVETSDQIARWEMEHWNGIENPNADPGGLLREATLKLLEDY